LGFSELPITTLSVLKHEVDGLKVSLLRAENSSLNVEINGLLCLLRCQNLRRNRRNLILIYSLGEGSLGLSEGIGDGLAGQHLGDETLILL
jgi:hypothetical protein